MYLCNCGEASVAHESTFQDFHCVTHHFRPGSAVSPQLSKWGLLKVI